MMKKDFFKIIGCLVPRISVLFLLGLLSACQSILVDPFPEPLREPLAEESASGEISTADNEELINRELPKPPGNGLSMVMPGSSELVLEQQGEPVRAAFNDVPLRVFIQEVFGVALGYSYVISPDLESVQDLVTLNLQEPLPRGEFIQLARRVLNQYGVDMRVEQGVLEFYRSEILAAEGVPLLVSGLALPEIPASHRTVFQIVPLSSVSVSQINKWLKQVMRAVDITLIPESENNSIILQGGRDSVRQALEYISILDQPFLRSKNGLFYEPVLSNPEELAERVIDILKAEGIYAGENDFRAAVVMLPMNEINRVVVFANSQQMISHVEDLLETLDLESYEKGQQALFTYKVQNTQAEQIVDTLEQLSATDNDQAADTGSNLGSAYVVDVNSNMIIYKGEQDDWRQTLNILRELDKSIPSVLIEVLIAEITLSDNEALGIEFQDDGVISSRNYDFTLGTLGGLGIGNNGLSFALNSAGATKAAIQAFYEDSKAVIRSRPNVLVKSGGSANIEVGNQIPVITSNAQGNFEQDGNTAVLQSISYRNTGVILSVTPVVQANGLVDIEVKQELSEVATSASTSLDGSPTILNRSISTELTLRDGGAVVIGGLISNNQSDGKTGVPVLSNIPLVGSLFSNRTETSSRTELIVMIAPYVIRNAEEARSISEALKARLELHQNDFL